MTPVAVVPKRKETKVNGGVNEAATKGDPDGHLKGPNGLTAALTQAKVKSHADSAKGSVPTSGRPRPLYASIMTGMSLRLFTAGRLYDIDAYTRRRPLCAKLLQLVAKRTGAERVHQF